MVELARREVSVILLLLAVSLLTSCTFSFAQDKASTSATQAAMELEEEYAVYNALIVERYITASVHQVVIRDHTALEPSENLDTRFASLLKNIPELTPEMVAEFRSKNASQSPLEQRFNLGVDYVLVSDEQLHQIFAAQDGWVEFNKQFVLSQGMMTLSRVAFNPHMDKALVYVGNQYAWLGGMGYYLLLVKEDGTWKILREDMAWIS